MPARVKILVALPLALLLQAQSRPSATSLAGGLSYGTIIQGEPVLTDPVPPHGVPVQADAVIAEQRAEVMGARTAVDRTILIGAPFNYEIAGAHAAFRRYRTAEGDRWCWSGIPGVVFSPPHDAGGQIFPGICLLDADGDGAFEAVRMLAYPPSTAIRDVAIAPVRLRPAPPADPRLSRLHVFRRVRIAQISGRAVVLVLEHALRSQGEAAPDYARDQPSERVALPLRQGATASIAGLALRVEGERGAWRIAASGAFARWAILEQGGAAVRLGPYFLAPRED